MKHKLIPIIAGLAMFCPLAIYHANAKASGYNPETSYYNESSYNNQPRQPYNYYDDMGDNGIGSTAGTYEKNYTGTEPHDSEVKSAVNQIQNTLGYDSNVYSTNWKAIDENMEYTPDPVDLKLHFYGYDSNNPNNKSLFYKMSDAQFNKGDTVDMGNVLEQAGDPSVNILSHPSNFTITKNTILDIPISEKVNAMINVTPVTEDNSYDGPSFTIYHLQPNQQFNLSKYMEDHGYNPINKNDIITVPNGFYDGLNSNFVVQLAPRNFDASKISGSGPVIENSSEEQSYLDSSENAENSIMNSIANGYDSGSDTDTVSSTGNGSYERTINYDQVPTSSSNKESNSLSNNWGQSSMVSMASNSSSNYDNRYNDSNNELYSSNSSSYSRPSSDSSQPASSTNNSDKYLDSNIDTSSNSSSDSGLSTISAKIFNRIVNPKKAKKSIKKFVKKSAHSHRNYNNIKQKKHKRIRYYYISKRRYRKTITLLKYNRKRYYRKLRRLRHSSKYYKKYKKYIMNINYRMKHLRIKR